MAGVFALSTRPGTYRGNFLEDLFWGTFYQQHLGEEYCGLSTYNGQKIKIQTHHGLFRPSFSGNLTGLEGTEGIGYCGPDREPFRADSKIGELTVCFSGNIINLPELVDELKSFGYTFDRGTDIEVITKLIAQGEEVVDGIKKVARAIKGAYSLLILTHQGIYAARGLNGHWPLMIGEKKGAVAVASESDGFSNFDFRRIRDLKPGEIILIKDGRWETQEVIQAERIRICSFEWVYTAFPNDVLEGIPASLVRKRLGAALARRDIERGFFPHIVSPVPDSGRFHAIGYKQAFDVALMKGMVNRVPLYDEVLLKYPYAGRSYTPQTKKARDLEAHVKILPSGESIENLLEAFEAIAEFLGIELKELILVICDDSIVRGTQTQTNLVPKLRSIGIKEIHFRISNPQLLSHCPWGKTTKKGETLAYRLPRKEDRIEFLGVESLEYCTIEDLVQAIGLPREQLCVDCDLAH